MVEIDHLVDIDHQDVNDQGLLNIEEDMIHLLVTISITKIRIGNIQLVDVNTLQVIIHKIDIEEIDDTSICTF